MPLKEEMGREKAKRKSGAPGEIRTPDLLLRRQSLYPSELRAPAVILVYMGGLESINVGSGGGRGPAGGGRRAFRRERLGVNQQSPSHSCEDRRCALVRTLILNFCFELLLRALVRSLNG